jgi:hypothetical protein
MSTASSRMRVTKSGARKTATSAIYRSKPATDPLKSLRTRRNTDPTIPWGDSHGSMILIDVDEGGGSPDAGQARRATVGSYCGDLVTTASPPFPAQGARYSQHSTTHMLKCANSAGATLAESTLVLSGRQTAGRAQIRQTI